MKYLYFFLLSFLIIGCAQKKKERVNIIEGEDIEQQMILTYNTGYKALEDGDVLYATKLFNDAELLYPQSDWAPRSALMAAYAYYTQGYYNDSILELKRYLKVYQKMTI